MEPIVSFSGLASGFDFQALVDEIVRVERRPAILLEDRIEVTARRIGAFGAFRGLVDAFDTTAEGLAGGDSFRTFTADISGVSSGNPEPISASPSAEATPGQHEIGVHQLARREKVGSRIFDSSSESLGLSGELRINGSTIRIDPEDTLEDVRGTLDEARLGPAGTGVSASILAVGEEGAQLVLTADSAGDDGVDLVDGPDGLLRSLGFLEAETEIKHGTSDGARSDAFTSTTADLATLLDLESPPGPTTVTVGGLSVDLELSTMSLQDVADAIDAEAGAQGSGIEASVVSEEDADGTLLHRVDVSGTTTFSDGNGVLELVGILEAKRGAVPQEIEGAAMEGADGTSPADASTLLTDLHQAGASAGVQAGDTLEIAGTRGDGTTFEKTFTVTDTSTLEDLVTALNDAADAFQAGERTATAGINADGQIEVVDDEAGASQLDLQIVANNEGGGTLDFGSIEVVGTGRKREITPGQDALFEVDGNVLSRSTNVVNDAIQGMTLHLEEATGELVTLDIARDTSEASTAIGGFVESYNEIVAFVREQFSGVGADEDSQTPPLAGNVTLRTMSRRIRSAIQTTVTESLTGGPVRLAQVGIEVDRDGFLQLDSNALETILAENPLGVERLFGASGTTDGAGLSFVQGGPGAESGTYAVELTEVASRASATSSGFGGTFVDDGTPDVMSLQDLNSGSIYQVELSDGMTLSEIVNALNSEFDTPLAQRLQTGAPLHADDTGTLASASTVLADLHDGGGTPLGVGDGDTITFSGNRRDGSSFSGSFDVTDISTQTLGDVRNALQDAIGSDATVSVEEGRIVVADNKEGTSLLSFSIASDNAGGGTLDFGETETVQEGRTEARIEASESGGELMIAHDDYGSLNGFDVSFTPGGSDGTGSLGLTAGTYAGDDVEGTIGGFEATGRGQLLTGAENTPVDDLTVRFDGTSTGNVGSVTFGRGVASAVELVTEALLGSDADGIDQVVERLDGRTDRLESRIERIDGQLARRRENLLRRFSALEEALADAQAQGRFLQSQLSTLSAR